MTEIKKIEERYQRRKEIPIIDNFYFRYFAKSERELIFHKKVSKLFDTNTSKILEIGAGNGDNLLFFKRLGFKWHNIYANELLPERFIDLKNNLPTATLIPGNALDLNFQNEFDIVFQSTVFTSILDDDFKRKLALKMMQVVKKDGIILWYDFTFDNPKNPDVKGIKKSEIKSLFREAKYIDFQKVTLAPPISRRIGRFYNPINSLFPFLRTHIIAVIKL